MKICSVDIASDSRPSDIVWVGNDGLVNHNRIKGVPAIVEYLDGIGADVIAVDASSKSAISGERGRNSEKKLNSKGIKIYYTSDNEYNAHSFMQAGFSLYKELSNKGYKLLDKPGKVRIPKTKPSLIEFYPHAAFTVGLGYIPYNKNTLAGIIHRVGYLKQMEKELKFNWNGGVWDTINKIYSTTYNILCSDQDFLIEAKHITHDVLDALVGLIVIEMGLKGKTFCVGREEDGVIVLPGELSEERYKHL